MYSFTVVPSRPISAAFSRLNSDEFRMSEEDIHVNARVTNTHLYHNKRMGSGHWCVN